MYTKMSTYLDLFNKAAMLTRFQKNNLHKKLTNWPITVISLSLKINQCISLEKKQSWNRKSKSEYTQILVDQLTLFQSGGTNYGHLITAGTPGFLDLPTVLMLTRFQKNNLHTQSERSWPIKVISSSLKMFHGSALYLIEKKNSFGIGKIN